jgi:excisionase family DNA binding protein
MKAQDRAQRLVYTITEAARVLGLSRNGAYAAAKRGDIPTIRLGRRLLVPMGPLHKLVGAGDAPSHTSNEKCGSIADPLPEKAPEDAAG